LAEFAIRQYDVSWGKSYFRFIPQFWYGHFSTSNDRPIHRLCNLMRKLDAGTAILEELPKNCDEVKNEVNALQAYFNGAIEFKIYRVSFLSSEIYQHKRKIPEVLSTSIIINFRNKLKWYSYIYNAFVTVPFLTTVERQIDDKFVYERKALFNWYVHTAKLFTGAINISNSETIVYEILGNYFTQQNKFTSVCAHAALCMTVNNIKSFDSFLEPEDLNYKLKIDHINNKLGKKFDFHVNVVSDILKSFDFSVVTSAYGENDLGAYPTKAYRYIEGRCPSMLVFSADRFRHIVPIVGHTFNPDLWTPEAERAYTSRIGETNYTSAMAWVDNFIIHDDNYGMYCCLPCNSLKKNPNFMALLSLSIVPDSVVSKGHMVEWANTTFLESLLRQLPELSKNYWVKQLKASVTVKKARTPFVARTFIVNKSEYIESLRKPNFNKEALSNKDISLFAKGIPDIFWLTEYSLPDLFTTNQSKIADFAYRCDIEVTEDNLDEGFLFAKFPHLAFKAKGNSVISNKLSTTTHHPCFCHQEEFKPIVW
jgi:hypothetical protein